MTWCGPRRRPPPVSCFWRRPFEPLTLLLDEDQEREVQVAAIRAMGEIGGEEAEAILVRLLESDEPYIAEAAELAIEELQMMAVDFQAEALQ